jgi:putative ABC transport system permease protein
MNILELVLKQMRQRALSTWLTLLSITLGVGLAISILLLYRQGERLFTQADYGFDIVVGSKTGGSLNTVLNAVYQLGGAPVTIGYGVYEDLAKDPSVRWAVPWAVGDNYQGHRVIGTSPRLLGMSDAGAPLPPEQTFQYRDGKPLALAQGKAFHARKFEAVIGAEVAEKTGLALGATFKASHGAESAGNADEHDEKWTVVGILTPTYTAMDRVIFVPIVSALAVPSHARAVQDIAAMQAEHTGTAHDEHVDAPPTTSSSAATPRKRTAGELASGDAEKHAGHADHEEAYCLNEDGTIDLHLPKEEWRLSAVLLRTIYGKTQSIIFQVNNLPYAAAVNPAREMRSFFDTFFKGSRLVLLLISALVTVVAAVGILVSIYNSVAARLKEIAIIRALGATRAKVLGLICTEAALIGLLGGVLGLLLGHAAGAVASVFFQRIVGESINFWSIGGLELLYVATVVVLSAIAGLVPAMKAYRTPVATHLAGA